MQEATAYYIGSSRELQVPSCYVGTLNTAYAKGLETKQNTVEQFSVSDEATVINIEPQAVTQAQGEQQPIPQGNIFDAPSVEPQPQAVTQTQGEQQPIPQGNIFDTPDTKVKVAEDVKVAPQADVTPLPTVEEVTQETSNALAPEEIGVLPDTTKKPNMEYSNDIEIILSYMIKEGDSVYSISSKFGIPADRLCEINGIDPSKDLTPGRLIAIPNLPDLVSAPEKQLYKMVSDKLIKLSDERHLDKTYEVYNGIASGL